MNKTKHSLKIIASLLFLVMGTQHVSANMIPTSKNSDLNVQTKEYPLIPIENSFTTKTQSGVIHDFDDLVLSSNAVPHTKKVHSQVKHRVKGNQKVVHKKGRHVGKKLRGHAVSTVDTPLVQMEKPQALLTPEPNVIEINTSTANDKPIIRETTITNVTNPVYLNSNGVAVQEMSATPIPVLQKDKKVTNQLSIGTGVSHKKTEVNNLYSIKGKPNYKVFVENETRINQNDNLSHVIKLGGNVDYNRKTANILGEPVKHAGQVDYGINAHYSPELKGNAGSVYPIFGIGIDRSQLGTHKGKKLETERDYVDVGLGASANFSPYQKVFVEGTYARDFRVKHKDQYSPDIAKQTVKGSKGQQYTVEMGVKSKFNKEDGHGYTVSMYHSEYKNKNGHNLTVDDSPMQVGKTKQTENGVKMSVDF